tara:strand:+ start:1148 stop:3220 length:2073 start_codon:yes stop_codon:yes gene_type:complete
MPLVNFSNLDFNQIKENIQDYLRSNSDFTDYDFDGSNLSTIIDTLAYNTYIASYNTNMVANECFIDSATLRENVVSLARNIGYTPRSRRSAKAIVSFEVDTGTIGSVYVTLKAGIVCITANSFNNNSFTFSIPNDITVPVRSDGTAEFNNIEIYEGTYVTQNFTVSSRIPDQRFILDNPGIDTSLIQVSVRDSESSTVTRTYKRYGSLFDVKPNSAVYFLQEVENQQYQLLFGDGIFGKALEEPNFIEAKYIVTNGKEGNSLSNLNFAGTITDQEGRILSSNVSVITTDAPGFGGDDIESVESIKKYASQIYSSQNRAVTASDYEAIIPMIYAEAESVSVYGGETLTPPVYGKVFITIKPYNGVFISNAVKNNIKQQLSRYSVAGIVPEIIDLKYIYVEINSKVYFNSNLAPSAVKVKTAVEQNIEAYSNSTELNKFGSRFKYSKFQKIIDDSHESITSNITRIDMRRDLQPQLQKFAQYEICFGNRFYVKSSGFNIRTTGFRVSGISDVVYLGDTPDADMMKGSVFLFSLKTPTEPFIVKRNIGTIDYVHGEIKLNPIKIISAQNGNNNSIIEVSAIPISNDVIGLQDLYLILDNTKTKVNTVVDLISSGDDISGSNYTVTSSYETGDLVRGKPLIGSQATSTTTTTQTTTVVTPTSTSSSSSVSVSIPSPSPSPSSSPSSGSGGYSSY